MAARELEVLLTSVMAEKGWSVRRICKLEPVYSRNEAITPFFFNSSIDRRGSGTVVIDGAVGVVHEEFESLWLQSHPGETSATRAFCIMLHIANFSQLNSARFIQQDNIKSNMDAFASAVSDLLNSFPGNQTELIQAFEADQICGRSLAAFTLAKFRPKFVELRRFLLGLRAGG